MHNLESINPTIVSPSEVQKTLRDVYHAVLKALENYSRLPMKNSKYLGDTLWINYVNPGTTYHATRRGWGIHIGRNGFSRDIVLQNVGGVFVLRDFGGNDVSVDRLPYIMLRFSREILGQEKRPSIVAYKCPPKLERERVDNI